MMYHSKIDCVLKQEVIQNKKKIKIVVFWQRVGCDKLGFFNCCLQHFVFNLSNPFARCKTVEYSG